MTLDTTQVMTTLEALKTLAGEERALITAGRLDELETIARRRAELMSTLTSLLPPGTSSPETVREALKEAEHEAQQSLILLCALRDEIASRLDQNQRTKKATGAYARNL